MLIDNKNIKILIRSIIVFLIFWFHSYIALIPIKILNLDVHNLTSSQEVILSTFSSFALVIIFSIIYFKDLKIEFKKFRSNLLENLDYGFRYWFIGLLIMTISNLIITFVFKSGGANNENAVQDMIKVIPWLMFINAGVIAPFNEELVFRKTIKDICNEKWVFVITSFLLFGTAHVINSATTFVDYLYIIPYGALGGAFALAYHKTDTVFTGMVMHMFHNTVLVLVSVFL